MRTVSTALAAMLESGSPRYFRRAVFYPRVWGGSSYSFDTGVDISSFVVSTSPLKIKLDKDGFGEWTYSNCSLTLRNERNQFKEGNTAGFLSSGIIRGAKIVLQAGSLLEDGTEDIVAVFTGYVYSPPTFDPANKTVTFTLLGRLAELENISAEGISTTYTDVSLGSDSGTEFTTTTDKVGEVLVVKKGPTSGGASGPGVVELVPSTDYSVSDTDKIGTNATITLTDALTSGESVWASWRQWYGDKTLEWIVQQICSIAGITSYDITPVTFKHQVQYFYEQDTQDEWKAGTLTRTDADKYPGSVQLSLIPTLNRSTWYSSGLSGVTLTPMSSGTVAQCAGVVTAGNIYSATANDTGTYGTWDFRIISGVGAAGFGAKLLFVNTPPGATNYVPGNGYACGLDAATGKIKLWRIDSGTYTELWTSTGASYYFSSVVADPLSTYNFYRVRVSRNSSGEFFVAIYDAYGVLIEGDQATIVATDTTYTTATFFGHDYTIPAGAATADLIALLIMRVSTIVSTGGGDYEQSGNLLSEQIDGGADLAAWGTIAPSQTLPAGTLIAIETRERASTGDAWDAWVAVTSSGQVVATKRYLQLRWSATANTAQTLTPIIYSWTLGYTRSTIVIPLVNMRGLSCLAALEQLAQMACYEIGFDAQETFIFRPRATGLSPVAEINSKNVIAFTNMSDGADRIFNRVVAEYGNYRTVADPTSEGDTAPTSQDKFGVKELSIQAGNFLLADAADLAIAVAPTVYEYTSKARRRVSIDARFDLRLELGDRVRVNYNEDNISILWRWGDSFIKYVASTLNVNYKYYGNNDSTSEFLLLGVDMRVEGMELDLDGWKTRYDLVEVL